MYKIQLFSGVIAKDEVKSFGVNDSSIIIITETLQNGNIALYLQSHSSIRQIQGSYDFSSDITVSSSPGYNLSVTGLKNAGFNCSIYKVYTT